MNHDGLRLNEKRAFPRHPIRLKVRYRSAQSLVTEYTSSISRGGCLIRSGRPLEVGTRFVFEMYAENDSIAVEVEGKVVRSRAAPDAPGVFEVGVQYLVTAENHPALDRLLTRILVDPNYEVIRQFPRIPVNLVARDATTNGLRYLVHDVSMGGLGLLLPVGRELPAGAGRGVPVSTLVDLSAHSGLLLTGRIAWAAPKSSSSRARIGVQFSNLGDSERMIVSGLTRLLRPRALWLRFGQTTAEALASAAQRWQREGQVPVAIDTLAQLVSELTCQQFLQLTGQTLEPQPSMPTPLPHDSRMLAARVGLVGAVEGGVVLRASPALGQQLAAALTNEATTALSPALVHDALAEFLTSVGGALCDRLEAVGYDAEVTPPLEPTLPERQPRDSSISVILEGAGGRVEVEVVLRPPPDELWP